MQRESARPSWSRTLVAPALAVLTSLAVACDGESAGAVADASDADPVDDARPDDGPTTADGPAEDGPAGDGPAGDGPGAEANPGALQVSGRYAGIFVTTRGESRFGFDLRQSAFTVHALGPDGRYSSHMGSGTQDGSFSVPDVPAGPFWLRVFDTYLPGGPDQVAFDLTEPLLGRTGTEPAPPGTRVRLALRGLSASEDLTDVYLFAPDVRTYLPFLPLEAATAPEGGLYHQGLLDVGERGGNLVEGPAAGDLTFLVESSLRFDGGVEYWEAQRAARTSKLQMVPGGEAQLEATLEVVPARETLAVELQAAALLAMAPALGRGAVLGGQELQVLSVPGAVRHGHFFAGAHLALARISNEPVEEVRRLALTWGNPFPSHWGRLLVHLVLFAVELDLGPRQGGWPLYAVVKSVRPIEPGQAVTAGPLVGPPRDVLVDGRAPGPASTGAVGLTPRVTWRPPALGAPQLYRLDLYALVTENNERTTQHRGNLLTTATEVRLPPGMLLPGQPAAVIVRAVVNPTFDPRTPFLSPPEIAFAETVAGPFLPGPP